MVVRPQGDDGRPGCIDEDIALAFVQGHLSGQAVQRVDDHADGCASCRALIKEAVRAFRGRATEPGMPSPPLTRFVPGDELAGRYKIVRFIAAGGMGEVYEAQDRQLRARVAIKTLAATVSDDPQAIRRLQLELNLTKRIVHPNVCRMFDIGVHEPPGMPAGAGVTFITMELVPGQSLGQALRAGGPLPIAQALPIVEAMVAALGAAHHAGIIHRDFKSDNVMLAPSLNAGDPTSSPPWVVVMDFGLARASVPGIPSISTTFDSRSLVGTLAYMAPEQMQGKPVTPATDIYALGVVMFEMVTGELPFGAEPPRQTASRRLAEAWRAGGGSNKGLDRRWEMAILRCLQPDPQKRYRSVDEVASALRAPISPHATPPSGIPKPPPGRAPRMPLWRLWPVAVGTAFLAGAIVYAARMRQDASMPAVSTITRASPGPSLERTGAGASSGTPAAVPADAKGGTPR